MASSSMACFLHGLECRFRDPHGKLNKEKMVPFGGVGSSRSRATDPHPYLGSLLNMELCSPCAQRVRFTREALRRLEPAVKRDGI